MKKAWSACLLAGALSFPAFADTNPPLVFPNVERFATLPDGVRFPEGIAASPEGDVFVGTFDFGPNSNKVVRFSRNGQVSAVKDFGPTPLLGLEYRAGQVYILNFGASQLQRLPANFDETTPVQTVKHDPLLATAGFPPFGANGLALSPDESTLFIANTGDDRVLKMDVATTALTVMAESINGADGLLFTAGRLWVCANQGDVIFGLNAQGRPVVRVGSFDGVAKDGRPDGLLFPASLAALNGFMYVTNLALPLTPMVGDEPEEDVTRWTVSRFRIPQ
jgi:hypothetical protein